jgi:branched-subunit amino acid aminotransferase/4-amino-4-deoxychorismate lyase
VTGTFAGLVPVGEIDGRVIGALRPVTRHLQEGYADLVDRDITARAEATRSPEADR